MSSTLNTDTEYKKWLAALKEKIRNSQLKAALKVNTEIAVSVLGFGAGDYRRQAQSDWGDKIITNWQQILVLNLKK